MTRSGTIRRRWAIRVLSRRWTVGSAARYIESVLEFEEDGAAYEAVMIAARGSLPVVEEYAELDVLETDPVTGDPTEWRDNPAISYGTMVVAYPDSLDAQRIAGAVAAGSSLKEIIASAINKILEPQVAAPQPPARPVPFSPPIGVRNVATILTAPRPGPRAAVRAAA